VIRDVHVRAAALRIVLTVGVAGAGRPTRRAEEVGVVAVVVNEGANDCSRSSS
jgi:hypothetical protein